MKTTRVNESLWVPWPKGPQFQVTLLKFDGTVRETYHATLSLHDEKRIELRAKANKKLEINNFTINPGDEIYQYFRYNQWFYIQEYSDRDGELKGWYCNIGTPPIVEGLTLTTRDLILDIFVDKNRNTTILDETEFEEKNEQMTSTERIKVSEAREKILRMVEAGATPFFHDYPRLITPKG